MPAVVRTISRQDARRIAVRAQLLDADRAAVAGSDDLADVVAQLTVLPLNPSDIVCPSAEHIAWMRLPDIGFDDVRRAVEVEQTLFEHLGPHRHPMAAWAIGLRAMRDLPWLLAIGREPTAIGEGSRAWLEANSGFRERVLEQLRLDGPLPQADIADTVDAPFRSSGWNTGPCAVVSCQTEMPKARAIRSGVSTSAGGPSARMLPSASRISLVQWRAASPRSCSETSAARPSAARLAKTSMVEI